jgi:hypothetical protein
MWHWKRTWEPLQISINRGLQPKERGDSWRYKFSSRQVLQARKLSQKFSSLLHLRLKSTKNEALLDQAKTPHKSSSTTLWRQIKGTLQSIKSPYLAKLCWIKPKRSIRVLQQHFEDESKVLLKVSNHHISLRNTRPNSRSSKAQISAWLLK